MTIKRLTPLFLVLAAASITSCSSTYKPIKLQNYSFKTPVKIVDSVYFAYVRNIQRISDNGWYAKKERKKGMIALGVKLENHTSVPLVIEKEYVGIYGDGVKREIISPDEYASKVKQKVWLHLAHSLYNVWIYTSSGDIIPIPIGTAVGGLNAMRAAKANRANAKEMKRLEIWNKTVPAHGELYGVILIKGSRFEDYEMKFEIE